MVIVGDGTAATAGVERLLSESPRIDLKVVRRGGAGVLSCIRDAEPQVIVVPSVGAGAANQVSIEGLLRECPAVRVVLLRFEQSSVDVYHVERIEYTTVSDFLSVIEGAGTERETDTPTGDAPPSGAPGGTPEGR